MGRKKDPQSDYRMSEHRTKGYVYASTQRTVTLADGRTVRRHVHWGRVAGGRFEPSARFLRLSAEERAKFSFPERWTVEERPAEENPSGERPATGNRLYGDVWLLEQIARRTGLREDLDAVFAGSPPGTADAVLALAIYLVATGWNFDRAARWQRIAKTPCERTLTPKRITLLAQSITDGHRAELLRRRAARVGPDAAAAMDSTSISTWGVSLADARWGRNKDHLPLEQILDVTVYDLDAHLPAYYRAFPGNVPDSRTLRAVREDLRAFGLHPAARITDRGYASLANLDEAIRGGEGILTAVKTSWGPVAERIAAFGRFDTIPKGMRLDPDSGLAWAQYDWTRTVDAGGRKLSGTLHINLYLNPVRRTAEVLEMETTAEAERRVLAAAKASRKPVEDREGLESWLKWHDATFTKRGAVKSFALRERAWKERRARAGFFASATHGLDWSAMEAHRHYRRRDEQEKYFQQKKGLMGADRPRSWSEEGWNGRQLILFAGLILSCALRETWKRSLRKVCASTLEVLDEMRSIRCIEHPGRSPVVTPFVGKQLEIARAFGFEPPEGCAPSTPPRPHRRKNSE